MVTTRSGTGNEPGEKRKSTYAEGDSHGAKKARPESNVAARVLENDERVASNSFRESPGPMETVNVTPSSRRNHTQGMVAASSSARSNGNHSWASPGVSTPFAQHQSPSRTRVIRQPTKRPSIKAQLQDVVKIIMRQNKIRRMAACFTTSPVGEGDSGLCKRCAALDLSPQDFVISSEPSAKDYTESRDHGTLFDIYAKAYVCRLCRLIMKSIAEQPYAKLANVVERGQTKANKLDVIINAACLLNWQTDGRIHNSHKTRRLSVEWIDKCYEPIYLVMVSPRRGYSGVPQNPSTDFLARHLQPVHEYYVKIRLIGRWLKVCQDHHGDKCRPKKGQNFEELRGSTFFGVIDVEEMCFKPLPPDSSYVALSYQWGADTDTRFTTKKDTVLKIMERNGLSQYLERLPRTIRETIDLVRDLGLKYLWIDSLCIVQDSRDAWDRNATVMDLVYGNAILTVCAADGEDANAGLWALSKPEERATQSIEWYDESLELMARYPCEVYVKQSTWNTRAWTFQERLLSKRCLIFTQGRVYFQCGKTTMCEDVDMETPATGTSLDLEGSPDHEFKDSENSALVTYMDNVALYTARELTKPDDILSAFGGVGKTLCERLGAVSLYGLPNSHFDLALLWDPQDAPRRRMPGEHLTFPSWSWCGWDQRRMEYKDYFVEDCLVHLNDWILRRTWITWYIRDGNGDLRLVWDRKRHNCLNSNLPETMDGYVDRGEREDPHYDYYGRRIPDSLLGLARNEFKRTIPDFPVQVRTLKPGDKSAIEYGGPDRSVLQFWTWSAYFTLRQQNPQPQGRIFSRRYSILDKNGSWAGTIVLDRKLLILNDKPHHFIAISEARRFWETEGKAKNNYSQNNNKPWPLYNVLLLGYDEMHEQIRTEADIGRRNTANGETPCLIAYRVGLGKIYQEAFEQACASPHQLHRNEWREIVLG